MSSKVHGRKIGLKLEIHEERANALEQDGVNVFCCVITDSVTRSSRRPERIDYSLQVFFFIVYHDKASGKKHYYLTLLKTSANAAPSNFSGKPMSAPSTITRLPPLSSMMRFT